jgi:hypothetical protein
MWIEVIKTSNNSGQNDERGQKDDKDQFVVRGHNVDSILMIGKVKR